MDLSIDNTKITIDSYNACADAYQKKFMDLENLYTKLMNEFELLLSPDSFILDLGCGPGNFSKFLQEKNKGYLIEGVDLSPAMIDLANANVPNGNFSIKDIRSLNYPSNTFDAVIASFCFVHLTNEETEKVLSDLNTCIKEKGLLYIAVMEGDKSIIESSSFSCGNEFYYNFYTEQFLVDALIKNNFAVLKVGKQDYLESDGSVTIDMVIYAQKNNL